MSQDQPTPTASDRKATKMRISGDDTRGLLMITPGTAITIAFTVTSGGRSALLAATLTAIITVTTGVAAAFQPLLCALVQQLPQIMRAWSDGRAMDRVTKAAVCGPDKTPTDAESKRSAARAYASSQRWNTYGR